MRRKHFLCIFLGCCGVTKARCPPVRSHTYLSGARKAGNNAIMLQRTNKKLFPERGILFLIAYFAYPSKEIHHVP